MTASENLAANLRALRELRNLTQSRLSVEELSAAPKASARLYRADELPRRVKTGVTVRQLVPDAIPGLMVERMSLPVGARMSGVPHTPGTREYLCCE